MLTNVKNVNSFGELKFSLYLCRGKIIAKEKTHLILGGFLSVASTL